MKFICLLKHKWRYYQNPFENRFRVCKRCGKEQIDLASLEENLGALISVWEDI